VKGSDCKGWASNYCRRMQTILFHCAGNPQMKIVNILLTGLMLSTTPALAGDAGKDVEAATANGDKVVLHPNGRWEFVDAQKAQEAKKVAEQFPENQVCPPGSQGGAFGIGRCIPPGDKDFNRRSLSGK
jgi:hypothetical protein